CRTEPHLSWSTVLIRNNGRKTMRKTFLSLLTCATLFPGLAQAQQTRSAHPDLSGVWTYAIDRAPAVLKKEVNGKLTFQAIDQSARHGDAASIHGVLPSTAQPSYKPQYQAKVKDLADHESKVDPVFYCGRPGAPRIGSPRKIVQLP